MKNADANKELQITGTHVLFDSNSDRTTNKCDAMGDEYDDYDDDEWKAWRSMRQRIQRVEIAENLLVLMMDTLKSYRT